MDWTDPILANLLAAFFFLGAAASSLHALLYRRDPRAALLWVGLIWFSPFVGSLLYLLFGINRVQRKAVQLRGATQGGAVGVSLAAAAPAGNAALAGLVRLGDHISPFPFSGGNRVTPLVDGDAAFPAMLEAIAGARRSIWLMTYIFDDDEAGGRFLAALEAARERGVHVEVLLDDVGRRYSFPSIRRKFRRRKIPFASFLPTAVPWHAPFFNLRNHRKLLVIDQTVAFTGGMNIRAAHWLALHPKNPTHDTHFKIEGPAVRDLSQVFQLDWTYTTHKPAEGAIEIPQTNGPDQSQLRVVPDGPDSAHRRVRSLLLGAVSAASDSIVIQTPYFLPDASLVSALNTSALRGVRVDILLPEKNNLPWVQWAMTGMLWQVLEARCRVWLVPPPFDHSKLMVVDEAWALFGSSNWDHRSLRLNFELNLESTDPDVARRLARLLETKRHRSRALTLAEVDARRFPARLRDGVARLFTPLL